MSLKTILTAIHTELTGNGVLQASAPFEFGYAPRFTRGQPTRIYWTPALERFSGPDPRIPRAALVASPNPARALRTRLAAVEAHLWAGNERSSQLDNIADVEQLLSDLVSAIHHQAYGNYELLAGRMVAAGSDATNLGHAYVLSVAFQIPLLETQKATSAKTITTTQQTTEMQLPSGQVVTGTPAP